MRGYRTGAIFDYKHCDILMYIVPHQRTVIINLAAGSCANIIRLIAEHEYRTLS